MVTSMTTSDSEKYDKRVANRRLRHRTRHCLCCAPDFDALILPLLREISDVWSFSKDGRVYRHNVRGHEMRK